MYRMRCYLHLRASIQYTLYFSLFIRVRSSLHHPSPDSSTPIGPNFSLPMAYAVIPPRHLAPTVGPSSGVGWVSIRTGTPSSIFFLIGLIQLHQANREQRGKRRGSPSLTHQSR